MARTRAATRSSAGEASTTSCGPGVPVAAPRGGLAPAALSTDGAGSASNTSAASSGGRSRRMRAGSHRRRRRPPDLVRCLRCLLASAGRADLQVIDHFPHALSAAGDLLGVRAVLPRGHGAVERHLALPRADVNADPTQVRSGDQPRLHPRGERRVTERLARRRADALIEVARPLLDRLAEIVGVLAHLLAGLVEAVLDLGVVDMEGLVALVVPLDR